MDATQPAFRGPALLSAGFRPFFLGAGLLALDAIPIWTQTWQGA